MMVIVLSVRDRFDKISWEEWIVQSAITALPTLESGRISKSARVRIVERSGESFIPTLPLDFVRVRI